MSERGRGEKLTYFGEGVEGRTRTKKTEAKRRNECAESGADVNTRRRKRIRQMEKRIRKKKNKKNCAIRFILLLRARDSAFN